MNVHRRGYGSRDPHFPDAWKSPAPFLAMLCGALPMPHSHTWPQTPPQQQVLVTSPPLPEQALPAPCATCCIARHGDPLPGLPPPVLAAGLFALDAVWSHQQRVFPFLCQSLPCSSRNERAGGNKQLSSTGSVAQEAVRAGHSWGRAPRWQRCQHSTGLLGRGSLRPHGGGCWPGTHQ